MTAEFGSRPEDLIAAIGPSIGPCCYSVGEQVHAAFRDAFSYGESLFHREDPVQDATERPQSEDAAATAASPGERPPLFLNLWEANRRQLLDGGIAPGRISVIGECTGCTGLPGARRYFSHRCEHGFTGRLMSVIGIVS